MEVKSVLNKDIYGANLTGTGSGYESVTKVKPTTGGTYANGIAALNPKLPTGLTGSPSKNTPIYGSVFGGVSPSVKMPDISSQFNSSVVKPIYGGAGGVGGGSTGRVTKEGAIIGGNGAVNTTFNGGAKPTTGGLGVTKLPTVASQVKYSEFQSLPKAGDSATTPIATAKKPETNTTQATQTEAAKETPATYEEYLEQQRELLDKRKTEADRQAEAAKERAAVDAQASYAQNMASYGTNAENLAQMGLQGGGYSDYLNAQAYAQKRADVQQANVTEQAAKAQNMATYEDALSELNKSEIEYKEKEKEKAAAEEEKKGSIYASLWEGALNPDSGYTEESVAAIGREYGLSDAQIKELQGIVSETKAKSESEKQAALKQGALEAINQGSLTESNIDSYLDSLKGMGATDKDVADIRESYQKNFYNDFLAAITEGTLSSTKSVDDAYNAGNLSKEHYESLKKAWNDDINTASNAFDSYDSYETAKKDYEEIMRNSWLSAETKSKLEKSFKGYEAKHYKSDVNSGYNAHSSTVTLNTPDGKVTVTYGVNSKTMKKSSGNAVFNTDVYKNAGSGQVFIVNGRPYVKLDNGDLGWVNDYLGRGALEKLKDTYTGTVYDIS